VITHASHAGTERELILAFLASQREVMLRKAEGLDNDQLRQRTARSELTLAGLLYHLALVEESWFVDRFAAQPEPEPWRGVDWDADPDWEFRAALELDGDAIRDRYRLAIQRADEIIAASDLDQLSETPMRNGEHFSLRWVLLHLIEETARHAGHADLLRESIDGATGE
jgi:uncharacterized damage-inducible protein DinB